MQRAKKNGIKILESDVFPNFDAAKIGQFFLSAKLFKMFEVGEFFYDFTSTLPSDFVLGR